MVLGNGGEFGAEGSELRVALGADKGLELRFDGEGLVIKDDGADFDDFHFMTRDNLVFMATCCFKIND